MEKTTNMLTRSEWVKLILGFGLFYGIVLRLAPGLQAGFPLNDGGMFLSMIRDLNDSHYGLPLTTSYNLLDIPYAYPPLGFYIARAISDLFSFSEISLLRWLPATFNILAIVVFFYLADSILQDRPRAALAAAFLAVIPGSYLWHIMGGGLTRSLGGLFLLLSVFLLKRLFETNTWKYLLFTILACSLAVLSHPEIILHTAGSCALVWLFYGRTRQGTLQAGFVAAGTLLLSSPWWLSILLRFGFDPFLSTLHTGMYGSNLLESLLAFIFARSSVFPVLLILRLLGIGWSIWKRKHFFLLAWSVLPVLVEPRSAGAIVLYPLTMLTAVGFADGLTAIVNEFRLRKSRPALADFTQNRTFNLVVMSMLLYLFMESFAVNFGLVNTSLKTSAVTTMEWVREHTPLDSQFLVLTGGGVMTDPVQEWFPALAGRHSQTTLQGLEWTLGPQFFVRYNQLRDLQSCKTQACVEAWSAETKTEFSYLLLNLETLPVSLQDSFRTAPGYELEYQNPSFAIYRLNQ